MNKTRKFTDKMTEMKEVEKFKKKVMGTFLKLYILHQINKEPQYGYILRDIIADKFGIKPSKASCYTKLYSLERGGFLTAESEKLFPPRPLPHRRYYSITEKGKELLNAMLNYLDDVYIPKIDFVKEEDKNTPRKQIVHPTS